MQYLAVLGRQPAIGLAELESLFGADSVMPLANGLALLTTSDNISYQRFGSVIKFAKVFDNKTHNISLLNRDISQIIIRNHPIQADTKLKIGISDYSGQISASNLGKLGLQVKKVLKNKGYSVRVVPNNTPKLSSAQIIHNKLISENGFEFVIFINIGGNLQLAIATYEQNIEAYSARDQARPKRDARVGMLPPKLAQTIINLATRPIRESGIGNRNWVNNSPPLPITQPLTPTILDPFCGTGVILQEAAIMGYKIYGTDLEERMIRYGRDNLQWLKDTHYINFDWFLETADATNHKWRQPIDCVATETYLGRPMSTAPAKNELNEIVQAVNTIHKKFLENLHKQITSKTSI